MIDQDFLEVKKENKNNPNKNITAIIVLLIVLLVGGFFVFKNKAVEKQKPEEEKRELKNIIAPQVARTSAENLQKEIPQGFPKEIPLNGKTKILESYNAAYPNSIIKQATISFESKNTSKQNYDLYLKWGKDNNWQAVGGSDEGIIKSVYLRKDNKDLNIVIANNVTIAYAEI